ncbi:hypothetical protein BB561_002390 [Smittium simulii]|uniref:Uncharacterized protein n=1 Tax=Smittium simulii TaxID=133385 RepID=A0A2T9YQV6_9FUNG|nr:hypothetical protein BB561_002390 [Smittium simulii]
MNKKEKKKSVYAEDVIRSSSNDDLNSILNYIVDYIYKGDSNKGKIGISYEPLFNQSTIESVKSEYNI